MAAHSPQPLLSNVHLDLCPPGQDLYTVNGDYLYYHYGCDGVNDQGWGCGYRTLQSMCSWVMDQNKNTKLRPPDKDHVLPRVPSIRQIQEALITMGDKEQKFIGSKDWIGSFEICLCFDHFYDVPCKILHIDAGKNLIDHIEALVNHFKNIGSPVMMGGESDSSSKGILGVCRDPPALLIMDPHYYGNGPYTRQYLQDEGWVKWRLIDEFKEHSFYNMCLPQLRSFDLK